VEKEEECEDESGDKVRELEPLIAKVAARVSLAYLTIVHSQKCFTYRSGEMEAKVNHPCARRATVPVQ
jgi:hypothetical protein